MNTPYYQDDSVTLYHGDCLEIREWLEADVLVTDPPYGISWSPTPIGPSRRNAKMRVASDPHGGGIAGDVSTHVRDAALDMWGDKPAYIFGSLLQPPPRGTKQVAIYGKPTNSGTLVNIGGVRRNVEAIYLIGRHEVSGGGRSAIFQTGATRVSGGKVNEKGAGLVQRYGHPHAKPVDVLEELITLTPSQYRVADPFAGSGSTLVAAVNQGRKAIGVELEERYCELIAKRLSNQTMSLFGGAS